MVFKLSSFWAKWQEKFPILSTLIPRYIFTFIIYFLFLNVIFFLMEAPIAPFVLFFFSLLLMAVQPIRDFLIYRRLQEEKSSSREVLLDREVFLSEDEFRSLMHPQKKRIPLVTLILIICNGLVFLIMTLNGGSTNSEVLVQYGAKVSEFILYEHEYWRLITANFIHVGALHLVMNMMVLYLFGSSIEKLYGWKSYWVIYFGSGLGGIVASTYLVSSPGAGASAALFGIIGALVVFGIRYGKSIPPNFRDFYTWILIFYIAMDFGFSILVPMVDTYAHLGGFLTGGFLALILNIEREAYQQLKGDSFSRKKNPIQEIFLVVTAIFFVLSTSWAFEKAYKNVRTPVPFYKKIEILTSLDSSLGIQVSIPKGWQEEESFIPIHRSWKSPQGEILTLQMEASSSLDPFEELENHLLIYQNKKNPLQMSMLNQFSLSTKKANFLTCRIYNPSPKSSAPFASQILGIIICHNYTYFYTLEGHRPERLYDLYQRLFQKIQFPNSPKFQKIYDTFQRNTKSHPKNWQILNGFAWWLAKEQSHLDEAIEYGEKSLQLYMKATKRKDPYILDTLAEVFFQKKKYKKAISFIQEAIQLLPKNIYLQKQLDRFRKTKQLYEMID